MKISEIIGDWLITTPIVENAYRRANAEDRITSLGEQVIEHLIKVLKWDDQLNKQKHLNDINSWLYSIQRVKLKTKQKKPSSTDYYQWLLSDNAQDLDEFNTIILGLHQYHDLPELRSNTEVYDIIKAVIYHVSNDLQFDRFKGISNYLN